MHVIVQTPNSHQQINLLSKWLKKKKTVKDFASETEVFESRIKEIERVFEKIKAIEYVDKGNCVLRIFGSAVVPQLQ